MSRPGTGTERRPPASQARTARPSQGRAARTARPSQARPSPARPSQARTAKATPRRRPGRVTPGARRRRVLLGASVVVSAVVLATGLPVASLMSQRHQLSTQSAVLANLRQENRALSHEHQLLGSNTEVERLAREDYQLVAPGQTLYEVLPPTGSTTGASRTSPARDPGFQPPVAPADAAALVSGSGGPATPSSGGGGPTGTGTRTAGAGGFVARVLRSLEFWQ